MSKDGIRGGKRNKKQIKKGGSRDPPFTDFPLKEGEGVIHYYWKHLPSVSSSTKPSSSKAQARGVDSPHFRV